MSLLSISNYIKNNNVYVTGKVGNQAMLTLPRQCRQKLWLDCVFVHGKSKPKHDPKLDSKTYPKLDPKTLNLYQILT